MWIIYGYHRRAAFSRTRPNYDLIHIWPPFRGIALRTCPKSGVSFALFNFALFSETGWSVIPRAAAAVETSRAWGIPPCRTNTVRASVRICWPSKLHSIHSVASIPKQFVEISNCQNQFGNLKHVIPYRRTQNSSMHSATTTRPVYRALR